MSTSRSKIVKHYVLASVGLGVTLGPGADAGPLALLWVAGFVHLANAAELKFDRVEVASSVAMLVSLLGAWFVSGKIAQAVAAALAAKGVVMIGLSGPIGLAMVFVATLGLNSVINALFTFRFLAACDSVMQDRNHAGTIILKAWINVISHQLLSVIEIPRDLVRTGRILFS